MVYTIFSLTSPACPAPFMCLQGRVMVYTIFSTAFALLVIFRWALGAGCWAPQSHCCWPTLAVAQPAAACASPPPPPPSAGVSQRPLPPRPAAAPQAERQLPALPRGAHAPAGLHRGLDRRNHQGERRLGGQGAAPSVRCAFFRPPIRPASPGASGCAPCPQALGFDGGCKAPFRATAAASPDPGAARFRLDMLHYASLLNGLALQFLRCALHAPACLRLAGRGARRWRAAPLCLRREDRGRAARGRAGRRPSRLLASVSRLAAQVRLGAGEHR